MIQNFKAEEWDNTQEPVYLCILPCYPDHLTDRFGINFHEGEVEGLGPRYHAFLKINSFRYFLSATADVDGLVDPETISPEYEAFLVCVEIEHSQNSDSALDTLLSTLSIDKDALIDCTPYLGPAEWGIYRLDDNNNEFLITRYFIRERAEQLAQWYQEKGHKQTYSVRKIEA